MNQIYEELLRLSQSGQPAALATVVATSGSSPQKVGAKILVRENGETMGTIGGGAIEQKVIDDALELMRLGKSERRVYHLTHDLGMCCGGTMEVFIEPLQRRLEIVIFGGGHVGYALYRQMKLLNGRVTLVDERPEFANTDRFPKADRIFCESSRLALKKINFHEQLFMIITTHDHQLDQELLLACAPLPWAYLGMIGSQRKALKALTRLRSEGISEDLIARIQTPMGLNIGAQTPEEIAVSIAAQIIAQRHGASGSASMSVSPSEQYPVISIQ